MNSRLFSRSHAICRPLSALTIAACLTLGATSARAGDIGLGVGLTWVFGAHGGEGLAAGVKAFTSRDENKGAGTLGVDYHFNTGAIRPNLGVAYVGDGYYGEANFGYNMSVRTLDFGLGAGLINSKD